jgi:hypothetical protein
MTEGWNLLSEIALRGSDEDDLRRKLTEIRDQMIRLLGGSKTKKIWRETSPIKRGRVKGERTYDDPAFLVKLYDELRADTNFQHLSATKLREEIGNFADEKWKFKYASTALGVAKALQRALHQRSEQENHAKTASEAIRRNMLAAMLLRDIKSPE